MVSTQVTQKLNTTELNKMLHGPGGAVQRDLLRKGLRVQTAAKRKCPVDHGRLRGSISIATSSIGGIMAVEVGTNVDYAPYVHNGTGLYGQFSQKIVPAHAKVMVFTGKTGDKVFARSTKGQKGVPFLQDALKEVMGFGA
jgi:hypothetical protein